MNSKLIVKLRPRPQPAWLGDLPAISVDTKALSLLRIDKIGIDLVEVASPSVSADLGCYEHDSAVYCIEVFRGGKITYLYGACLRPVKTLLGYLKYLRVLGNNANIITLVSASDPLDIIRRADIYVEQEDIGGYDSFFGRYAEYSIASRLESYAKKTRVWGHYA